MICIKCRAEGKRSTVQPLGTSTTLMSFSDFYDEDGVSHRHDLDNHEAGYRCSNGHGFTITSKVVCYADGCNFNRDAPTKITWWTPTA